MTDGVWPWTDWQQGARWDEWTWPRGLAAAALVLASVVGSLLIAAASIAPCVFGGPECVDAALPQLWAAAVVSLLGPLVVFGLRRRVVWALTPPALLAGLAALPLYLL